MISGSKRDNFLQEKKKKAHFNLYPTTFRILRRRNVAFQPRHFKFRILPTCTFLRSLNMLRAQAAIPARLVHVKLYKYIYIYALLNTIERKKEKKKKRKKKNEY